MEEKKVQFEILSPRKIKRSKNQQIPHPPPRNYLKELLTLILPPFLVTILSFVFRFLSTCIKFILSIFIKSKTIGDSSSEFNKRQYEQNIEDLNLAQQNLGFTNQVLVQEGRKSVNFFVPTFVACKIKSIQDVSVQSLTGNISCALLVYINYGDIPEQIVEKLENSIVIQLNRGEAMLLADDGLIITLKKYPRDKFLVFTIRKVFLAFMIQHTLWSPFEVIDLIISLTFNTLTIPSKSLTPFPEATGYDPNKQYKISFNCMRNSDKIPISFALDCVYGVYDLAQRRLESYHTRMSSYKQVIKHYEQYSQKQKNKSKIKQKGIHKKNKERLSVRDTPNITVMPPSSPSPTILNLMRDMAQHTVRRLSMRMTSSQLKSPPKKVKYFQYTHLVIPLYKYPGNVLITIFLPVSLLALLSLAIFFQEQDLSGRIGSIATMILGYIALIPSIKEQLPPSSKLTVIQALVYIETFSCMFCLYQSFMILDHKDYEFIWHQNIAFLICLIIHSGVFLFVLSLYIVHKLKWEPSYNYDEKIAEMKPIDNQLSWDNPYCDLVFLKYNQEVRDSETDKIGQKIIKIYVNQTHELTQRSIQPEQNPLQQVVSLSHFQDVPKPPSENRIEKNKIRPVQLQELKQAKDKWSSFPMSPRSMNEFVPPTEDLYYSSKK